MLVVFWFILAIGFFGCYYTGFRLNSLDLAPNFAGSLMALTNGIGALTGIAGPVFVGFMTPNVSKKNSLDILYENLTRLFDYSQRWMNGDLYFGLHLEYL